MRRVCIFSGSSHPRLTDAICNRLGCQPSKVDLRKFANGETSVEIQTSVREQDVFIVQSGSSQINDNVMELLIMISACKGGSAKSITAVLPYFPYSRQSKRKTHRGAITARMLANLMHVAGVNHVITVDLHANQMQGFFKCPVDNLVAEPLLAKWIRMNVPEWWEAVVVSKNPGGTRRVTSLADALRLSFGIVTTERRRSYAPNSLHNSAIFESMGTDGTIDKATLEKDAEEAEESIRPILSTSREHDFAHRNGQPQHVHQRSNGVHTPNKGQTAIRQRAASNTTQRRTACGNQPESSPLQQSTRQASVGIDDAITPGLRLNRIQTAPGITQPAGDEDGYEDPAGDEDSDERARDVITGRLIHGHIVDDDEPSPHTSLRSNSGSAQGQPHSTRNSSEDDPPDPMLQSFMSTVSHASLRPPGHGLGGTGDATASDEEEEEALRDPYIESTVTLVGNVRNKSVLIVDDIIDKAGSWIAAAETVVKRGGATKVYCMASHGLFGGDSLEELEACDEIEAIVVTDAFPIPEERRRGSKKLVMLDVSGLLAEAIRRNHHGESISQLYQQFE